MDDLFNKEPSTNFVRTIVCTISLFGLICLIQRHRYKAKWKRVHFSDDKETKLYYRYKEVTSDKLDIYKPHDPSLFKLQFFIEMIMLIANPIPYFDMYIQHTAKGGLQIYYFLSEIMLSIMVLRLFFIVRSYFNFSIYTDSYSKKLCQQYGFNSNIQFAIKACLINKPV